MYRDQSRLSRAEPLERRVLLSSVFTVSTTADSGNFSLRDAITFANEDVDTLTTIRFDLPGSGVQTIQPLSALPAIVAQVDIQGTTDSAGNPLIQLDGANAGSGVEGLFFNRNTPNDTKPSQVSGLIIFHFSSNGIDLAGDAPTDVFGCRIGTDSTGKHAHPNGGDGILVNTPGCRIGQAGLGSAFGNLISGNAGEGIEIGPSGADAIVQNCLIGTDVSGTSARPNSDQGIFVDAPDALIGGRRAHQGNVISGNVGDGILVDFGNCDILGNRIGTNAAGTASIPNGGDAGIGMNAVANVSIGDSTDAGRNIVSGNTFDGIGVANSTQVQINDNFIGTDITGTQALGNPLSGIVVINDQNVTISGCDISGNKADGVSIVNSSDVTVSFNQIGIDPNLKLALPNAGNGIELQASSLCQIDNNTIANNTLNGIEVDDSNSTGDSLIGNGIFSNGHLGIKLGADNNTPLANHDGTVAGPNDDQNFPIITSALDSGGTVNYTATLHSTPNTSFDVDFFGSDVADPSGFGEGQFPLGGQGVTTDANGNATLSGGIGNTHLGNFLAAIATNNVNGDSSEFSQAIKISGASIVGTVFNDANGNGKFDPGETGLKGRTVYIDANHDGLFNDTPEGFGFSNVELSAVTDAHGHFTIFGVTPGANRLRLLGTAGWQETFPAPSAAFFDLNVKALSEKSGIPLGQEKSTAKAATLAVDAGSVDSYVDLSGQTFAADAQHPVDASANMFSPPDPDDFQFAVAGTDDDPLYFLAGGGNKFHYTFTVPDGTYTLRLLFADPTSTGAGQRKFDVVANGATILKNFDIFAAAGAAKKAISESTNLSIKNKSLEVDFGGVIGKAIVSAIELVPA
jgi:parallel beta-helix repeat protein